MRDNSQIQIEAIQSAVLQDILGRVQFFQKPRKGILLVKEDVYGEVEKSHMENFKRYSFDDYEKIGNRGLVGKEDGVDMLICAWIHTAQCMKKSAQLAKSLLKEGGWWLFAVVLEDGLLQDGEHLGKEKGGLCSMQTVMGSISGARMLQPVIDCTRFDLGDMSSGEVARLISDLTGAGQQAVCTKTQERRSSHIEIAFGAVFVKEKARESMQDIIF